MDIDKFRKAQLIDLWVEELRSKARKVHSIKGQIVDILKGHTYIDDMEIYKLFQQIDAICVIIDNEAREAEKKIETL